jgi:hypothetical protein
MDVVGHKSCAKLSTKDVLDELKDEVKVALNSHHHYRDKCCTADVIVSTRYFTLQKVMKP